MLVVLPVLMTLSLPIGGAHVLQAEPPRPSAHAGASRFDPELRFPDMSAQDCTDLLERSGSLLCLGVPSGTEFGLDYSNWTVGGKFMGVKLVPPGVHFAWFR